MRRKEIAKHYSFLQLTWNDVLEPVLPSIDGELSNLCRVGVVLFVACRYTFQPLYTWREEQRQMDEARL